MSNKASREKSTERAQGFVIDYLSNHPCTECGETDVSVLTFHHIDPDEKRYNVSDMITHGYSVEKINVKIG